MTETTAATPNETRDAKLEIIMGREALDKLADATVLVLGCGGVGSNCCEALARGGIGHFVILDKDIIAPSNINRQAIAFHSTIGKRKVDVMEAMIHDINPAATVIKRTEYLLSDNIDDFFAGVLEQTGGKLDYVVDAIDTISAKLTIAKYAQDHDIRLVSSMGGANKLHPECLRFADIFDTVRDPMSRIMRKECKKRGIKSLHVLFSCEESVKTQPRDPSNIHERTELGTASFMPPIMGQMIAGEGRNVIPSNALLKMEVRGETGEINQYMYDSAVAIFEGCAHAQGCEYHIEKMGEAVDLTNDDELVDVLREAAGAVEGINVREDAMNFGGSEDATIIARRVQAHGGKAAFFVLGADRPSGHHTAKFDIDENAVKQGLNVWANAVERILG